MLTTKRYGLIKKSSCLLLMVLWQYAIIAQPSALTVKDTETPGSFPLAVATSATSFYYDKADATVVGIAAAAFIKDVQDITGKQISLANDKNLSGSYAIIAGTIGHCVLLDELITRKHIDISEIKNKWEAFSITIIDQPMKAVKKLLVIAGSDRRGTAYGIFHLSRTLGVSPFVWWADVTPVKRKQLFVNGSYTSFPPSVKYRGIFINDEDWGLQPWAAKHMDTAIKDIGPNTYAKVFELMLRLKANYIWPAMHPCTKAFYYYKENPKVADDYAIIIGGSHCEPMLRNNVFEWAENFEHEYGKKPGEWRYDLNKDEMYKYWDDRVKEAVHYESVYTVGMRGIHDGSMPGPKDPVEKLQLLEKVITDQRKILNTNFDKPASDVPQIFVPYKEVLSLYRRGLKLADDVTIIWPDDNHGYIRQLPNGEERKRSGGHGVYYHLSYWGAPQDYLWLSSISPSLISYEMSKAYRYGADRLWVFNVGDIKPAELEIQFAMDLAWEIYKWKPENASNYTKQWAEETFGKTFAQSIADIKNEYYLLANSGKPEHMNSVDLSFEQRQTRLHLYRALADKAQRLNATIPTDLKDAYYELILYPVLGARLMNEKILEASNSFYYSPDSKSENTGRAEKAKRSFDSIAVITSIYNDKIAGGKWNGIMSWHPRDQPVFKIPLLNESVDDILADSLRKIYFKSRLPLLIIPAGNYIAKTETAKTSIRKIDGLGINGQGVTRVSKSREPDNDSLPLYLDYEFSLPFGIHKIVVKCLPTFDVINSKNLRYSIELNDGTIHTVNVHAEADNKDWKENVIRGYSAGTTTHLFQAGKNKLRIWLKDPNLVINAIEFY